MPTVLQLNDKQDKIQAAISTTERDISRKLDDVEEYAKKIYSIETQRIYGAKYEAAKKKWETAKKKLKGLWKQSNANIKAIQKQYAREKKLGNPSIKKLENWTKVKAVRIVKGVLQILK